MTQIRVAPAEAGHAGELWTVQRAAYVTEAQLYHAPGIPPLAETLPEVRAELSSPHVLVFAAWHGSRLVGSVRGRVDGDRMEVARFAVAPDQQGNGVGTALLTALEDAVPATVRTLWLVTGARSAPNLRLYERHGYRRAGGFTDDVGVTLVRMEKAVDTRVGPRA